jgi:2,3-bisphosphoglycerate-independent phosphoglycerate mutase
MKYIIVVGDGMADYPVPELGNLTPLQVAHKPNIDSLTAKGRSGLLRTVPNGMSPGSDVAILSVLGYDPVTSCTGRGPLEAPARGIQLLQNDAAFRCNLITEKDGVLVDYSAGHITSKESSKLMASIKENFEKQGKIEFFPGLDYRHFMILRNMPKPSLIECTPPHDAIGKKILEILPKDKTEETKKIVALLRKTILASRKILASHPVNIARKKAGKNPGNMIWPWGGGKKPSLELFKEKYGLKAAVISAVDLVKGIGTYAGMEVIDVPGATGMHDTNYEGKAEAALKALVNNDLVFVHVEAPDEAGHIRDCKLKVKTIEDLDKRLVGKIFEGLNEPFAIAILPDHPTPITVGTHTRDPVPFTICSPFFNSDGVRSFDEFSARNGAFGLVEDGCFMSLLVNPPNQASTK